MSVQHKEWYLQPKLLFVLFTCANVLLFLDRGIVPGAASEFNAFIKDNVDTDTPDVFLGLLQSAFIVGLAVGSSVFGHLVHHHGRFYLAGLGCSIWMLAVFLSGMSKFANSYVFLVFARMLSGVGEASLQVNIPPWIQKTAPPAERGMWLSVFFTAIPVGTATGYAYSSLMAESLGWEWAYFVEAIVMAPLVLFMFTVAPSFPVEKDLAHGEDDFALHHGHGAPTLSSSTYEAPKVPNNSRAASKDRTSSSGAGGAEQRDSLAASEPSARLQIQMPLAAELSEDERLRNRSTSSNNGNSGAAKRLNVELGSPVGSLGDQHGGNEGPGSTGAHKPPSMIEEFGIIFSRPMFLFLVAGYAAQTATLIGLSTFGSAFMMGLGYFNTESQSSTIFGGLICLSGVLATPLGGITLDRMLHQATKRTQAQLQHFDSEAALTGGAGEVVRNAVLEAQYERDADAEAAAEGTRTGSRAAQPTHSIENADFPHTGSQQRPEDLQALAAGTNGAQDSELLQRRKMDKIMELITVSSLIAVVLLVMCFWLHNRFAFLALVSVGVGFCFFCTPAINMAFLLSVPRANQAFGLAMQIVLMHAFGDVPSPIIVGLIKDTLAPGCVGDEDDDGQDAATSDECRDDAPGLRTTILVTDLWLLWCVFFFGLVWYLNHFHKQRMERLTYCMPGGALCPCVKVPDKAEGEDSDDEGAASPSEERDKLLTKLIPSSSA